ncbi:MAG: hypothetical protein HOP15_08740, partial [Planctomycetes bacterium]|nr:hypothetical protein [Planctomycetota bacterium]
IALELQPGDRFGASPTRLGDLDGDRNPEIAVGAPAAGKMSAGEGAVWILTVDAEDRLVARNRIVRPAGLGPEPLQNGRELFGYALTSLSDLDGDGAGELAVGAPWFDSRAGITKDGGVWVLFLDRSGRVKHARELSAGTEPRLAGILDGDGFGAQTAALGDVDGDGIGDLAVGAHGSDDGGSGRGSVWILFLRADASVRAAREISATEGGFAGLLEDEGHLGHGMCALGDVDGDGVPDLAVGAPFADGERPDLGVVWILFLRRDGTVRWEQRIAPDQFSTGSLVKRKFGARIDWIGDVNGDGRGEVAVGAEGDSRVFTLARDGSVVASSTEAIYGGGALFLGPVPEGGALRYLHSNCKANEERGWVGLHRFCLELRPEYPRR